VDTEKNQTIDLHQTDSYTFNAEAGNNATRFKIVLQSDISTHATSNMENGIKVSIINNQLTINGMDGKASVHIYDVSGKAAHNFYKVDNNQVLDLDMQKGLYFIEISTASQCVKQKVLAGQN
ncbi:MAG: T9SS type A sorting domain-containing protein, partial [Paludibacter sp.]